jgi:hypothetical protein
VDDIETALINLKGNGVQLINESPLIGTGGKKIAFIHPKSTHGVLVELYELTREEPEIRLQRARVLADRVIEGGQAMRQAAVTFLRGIRSNGNGNN